MTARLAQLMLFSTVVLLCWAAGVTAYRASSYAACTRSAAWESVKDGVRATLVAPRAAAFPGLDKVRMVPTGDCTFEIRGFVDAVNLHGVPLRADFSATTSRAPDGSIETTLNRIETRRPVIEGEALPRAPEAGEAVGPEGLEPPTKAL